MLDILPRKGFKKIQNKKCHNKLLQGRAFQWSMTTGTWYLAQDRDISPWPWPFKIPSRLLAGRCSRQKLRCCRISVQAWIPWIGTTLRSFWKSSLRLAVWNGLRFTLAVWSFPAKGAANGAFKFEEWKCLSCTVWLCHLSYYSTQTCQARIGFQIICGWVHLEEHLHHRQFVHFPLFIQKNPNTS